MGFAVSAATPNTTAAANLSATFNPGIVARCMETVTIEKLLPPLNNKGRNLPDTIYYQVEHRAHI